MLGRLPALRLRPYERMPGRHRVTAGQTPLFYQSASQVGIGKKLCGYRGGSSRAGGGLTRREGSTACRSGGSLRPCSRTSSNLRQGMSRSRCPPAPIRRSSRAVGALREATRLPSRDLTVEARTPAGSCRPPPHVGHGGRPRSEEAFRARQEFPRRGHVPRTGRRVPPRDDLCWGCYRAGCGGCPRLREEGATVERNGSEPPLCWQQ